MYWWIKYQFTQSHGSDHAGHPAIADFYRSNESILALKTGQRIDAALILGYYKHLLTLPQQFFDTMRVGEIISRVNDAVKIRNLSIMFRWIWWLIS